MPRFIFEAPYDIDQYDEENPKEIEYHFFGSNLYEWKTAANFLEVYNWFNKEPFAFSIHFVPLHAQAPYEIHHGRPVNVDAHWLGTYRPKDKYDK